MRCSTPERRGVLDIADAGLVAAALAVALGESSGQARAADLGGLVDGGQEGTAEGARGLHGRIDGDIPWQVVILGAEAVQGPGAEGGADELGGAGVELGEGLRVRGHVGAHGVDDAHLIGVLRGVRQQFAHPQAAAAVLGELPGRGHQAGLPVPAGAGRGALAGVLGQLGLVVEHVHMRGPALHAEEDHVLGAGGEVGSARCERARWSRAGAQGFLLGEGGKGHVAEAGGRLLEEVATCVHGGVGRDQLR